MLNLTPVSKDKDQNYICRFSYDEEFLNFYKKETGAKTIRKSNVGKFIEKWFAKTFGEENK